MLDPGRDARRHRQRGLGHREHGGRRLRPRLALVAHPPRRVARAACCASRTRNGQPPIDPLLARRGPVAHLGALGRGEPPARRRRRARSTTTATTARGAEWLAAGVRAGPDRRGAARRRTSAPSATRSASCRRWTTSSSSASSTRRAGCSSSSTRPSAARVNRAFGLALRKRFCVSFDFELQAAATDDAIVLSMGTAHSFPLVRRVPLRPRPISSTRRSSRPSSRRRCSARAGAGTRRARSRSCAIERGKKVPPFLQRMRADDLLAAVFPAQVACQENAHGRPDRDPRPPARPADDARLPDRGDGHRAAARASSSASSAARSACTRATPPSPRRSRTRSSTPSRTRSSTTRRSRSAAPRALSLRRTLPEHQRDLGALDPEAIARVVAEARPAAARRRRAARRAPRPRRRRPSRTRGGGWLDELARAGRAARVAASLALRRSRTRARSRPSTSARRRARCLPRTSTGRARRATRRCSRWSAATPRSRARSPCARSPRASASRRGRSTSRRRSSRPRASCCAGASRAGARTGARRRLRPAPPRAHPPLHARPPAREIEPVSAQDFLRYLFERHHLTPRVARRRARGAARRHRRCSRASRSPPRRWESDVLAPRVAGYRAEWLDELCLAGEVAWARLSPRRSASRVARRSTSRATPITLAAARPRLAARGRARRRRARGRRRLRPPSRRSTPSAGAARSSSTTSRAPRASRATS